MARYSFTAPGLTPEKADQVIEVLQGRLNTYNDLHLTLKHVHWNVVGPSFIGVHEMIDPAGRPGAAQRRRSRRADRHPGRLAAGHGRRNRHRPGPGTTTRSTGRPCRTTWLHSTRNTTA